MGDTSNWEFAAVVASVVMGLAGLLVFTLIGTLGSWLTYARAARASSEAAKANVGMQDLARQMAMRDMTPPPPPPPPDLSPATRQIDALRAQLDVLMKQQARLQDTVQQMAEATPTLPQGWEETQATVRRLEDNLAQIAATVANLAQRQT